MSYTRVAARMRTRANLTGKENKNLSTGCASLSTRRYPALTSNHRENALPSRSRFLSCGLTSRNPSLRMTRTRDRYRRGTEPPPNAEAGKSDASTQPIVPRAHC